MRQLQNTVDAFIQIFFYSLPLEIYYFKKFLIL